MPLKNNTYTVEFQEKENVPNENEKEEIESLEVYEGSTKLKVTGPDENNKYIAEYEGTSKDKKFTIKYKIKGGESKEEDFIPNNENSNTGTIYVSNESGGYAL